MDITGRTALVTGANRVLGHHLAEQLRDRGGTVYAAARNPDLVTIAGVVPVRLDVTDEESTAEAAGSTQGVSILIKDAGSSTRTYRSGGLVPRWLPP
jgi:NAD(P)-dependent dehydrogenase (short-subunit alcohol dehydrogenase family)